MSERFKEVLWMRSSRKDLQGFPEQVRADLGHALYTAQQGETDPAAKPLKGFGGTRVMEIVDRHDGDTYRAPSFTVSRRSRRRASRHPRKRSTS